MLARWVLRKDFETLSQVVGAAVSQSSMSRERGSEDADGGAVEQRAEEELEAAFRLNKELAEERDEASRAAIALRHECDAYLASMHFFGEQLHQVEAVLGQLVQQAVTDAVAIAGPGVVSSLPSIAPSASIQRAASKGSYVGEGEEGSVAKLAPDDFNCHCCAAHRDQWLAVSHILLAPVLRQPRAELLPCRCLQHKEQLLDKLDNVANAGPGSFQSIRHSLHVVHCLLQAQLLQHTNSISAEHQCSA